MPNNYRVQCLFFSRSVFEITGQSSSNYQLKGFKLG